MLDPAGSEADAARAALLPLECSRRALGRLFASGMQDEAAYWRRLDAFGVDAIEPQLKPATTPSETGTVAEIATFPALMTARVGLADPLAGSRFLDRVPAQSAEQRMMRQPLRKHPGLSVFAANVRDTYITAVVSFFLNHIGPNLEAELVAALVAPPRDESWLTDVEPPRTYTPVDADREATLASYEDRVERVGDGFVIPRSAASRRCCVPQSSDEFPLSVREFLEELPALRREGDLVVVPTEVVAAKLAVYAYHGWGRLANYIYSVLPRQTIESIVDETPRVGSAIADHLNYRKPRRAFSPYFGSDSTNPQQDPDVRDPISRPDKRLVTIADTIRGSSDLTFGEPVDVSALFDAVCSFYPAPSRPGNDLASRDAVVDALQDAASDNVRVSGPGSQPRQCVIPRPKLTPLYDGRQQGVWTGYRNQLARQARASLPEGASLSPYLPPQMTPTTHLFYELKEKLAERAAVVESQSFATLGAVEPLVPLESVPSLTADDVRFLTRVGHAMDRRIEAYSLRDSMTEFTAADADEPLDVSLSKLVDEGWLVKHHDRDDHPRTYFSVPGKRRADLGIPNRSHDGWGEKLPSETTLHRVGIDLVALAFAARPEVDQVVRYGDCWRLQRTGVWPAVSGFRDKRLDVMAFDDGAVAYVAEVETNTGGAAGTRGAVEKLQPFPDTVRTWFVTPTGRHLPSLMSRLCGPEYFDIDLYAAPNSADKQYRPAKVRRKLEAEGILGDDFTDLLTYENVRTRLPEQVDDDLTSKIVGDI